MEGDREGGVAGTCASDSGGSEVASVVQRVCGGIQGSSGDAGGAAAVPGGLQLMPQQQPVCSDRQSSSGDAGSSAAGPGGQQVVPHQPGGSRDKGQWWRDRVEAAGRRARVLGWLAGAKYASWLALLLWYLGCDWDLGLMMLTTMNASAGQIPCLCWFTRCSMNVLDVQMSVLYCL